MTPEEFVQCFVREKKELLESWTDPQATTVGIQVAAMNLSPEQHQQLSGVLDAALRDAFYTVLLGLDGEASIGGRQEAYRLMDEGGHLLTGSGEIESEAYKAFHGPSQ